jgi:mevalonate pyrophosphate decarboxylase
LAHRAAAVVPERMERMEKAVRDRDFAAFGKLTMEDSNQVPPRAGTRVQGLGFSV